MAGCEGPRACLGPSGSRPAPGSKTSPLRRGAGAPARAVGGGDSNRIAGELLDLDLLKDADVLVNIYRVGEDEFCKQSVPRRSNSCDEINDLLMGVSQCHIGVEVYGREWGYSFTDNEDETGVMHCLPRRHPLHKYRATMEMGQTPFLREEMVKLMEQMAERWRGAEFNIVHNNSLDFADGLLEALGLKKLPPREHLPGSCQKGASGVLPGTDCKSAPKGGASSGTCEVAWPAFSELLETTMDRWGKNVLEAVVRAFEDRPTRCQQWAPGRKGRGKPEAMSKHLAAKKVGPNTPRVSSSVNRRAEECARIREVAAEPQLPKVMRTATHDENNDEKQTEHEDAERKDRERHRAREREHSCNAAQQKSAGVRERENEMHCRLELEKQMANDLDGQAREMHKGKQSDSKKAQELEQRQKEEEKEREKDGQEPIMKGTLVVDKLAQNEERAEMDDHSRKQVEKNTETETEIKSNFVLDTTDATSAISKKHHQVEQGPCAEKPYSESRKVHSENILEKGHDLETFTSSELPAFPTTPTIQKAERLGGDNKKNLKEEEGEEDESATE